MLTKESFLAIPAVRVKEVPVPELGDVAHVRMMSGTDRDEYESVLANQKAGGGIRNARATLVIRTLSDDKGNLLFDPKNAEELAAVAAKPWTILDVLFSAAVELNRIGAKPLKDAEKNSSAAASDDSTSSSLNAAASPIQT